MAKSGGEWLNLRGFSWCVGGGIRCVDNDYKEAREERMRRATKRTERGIGNPKNAKKCHPVAKKAIILFTKWQKKCENSLNF